jgi:hypothetical protein
MMDMANMDGGNLRALSHPLKGARGNWTTLGRRTTPVARFLTKATTYAGRRQPGLRAFFDRSKSHVHFQRGVSEW